MLINRGVSSESVSVFTGHKTIKPTESYYAGKKEEKVLRSLELSGTALNLSSIETI